MSSPRFVRAFTALQLTGAFAFVLILLSARISHARRHWTWWSFCLSWVVYSISFSLLPLAGQLSAHPARGLCITQSALVYSASPLTTSVGLSLILNVLLDIHSTISESKKGYHTRVAILVITPWICWLGIFIGFLKFGLGHSNLVRTGIDSTYCSLYDTKIKNLTPYWIIVVAVLILCTEGVVVYLLYRYREILVGDSQARTVALRMAIFIVGCVMAIGMSFTFAVTKGGIGLDIMLASTPISAALVFGSQRDLFRGWVRIFRRGKARTELETDEIPPAARTTVHKPRPAFTMGV